MQSTTKKVPHSGLRYGETVTRPARLVTRPVRIAQQKDAGYLDPFGTRYPLPAVLCIFIGYYIVKWVRLRLRISRGSWEQSRRDHFQMSVQIVSEEIWNFASGLHEHQADAALSANIEPQSGYFNCSFREFQLYDKKTTQMFTGPASDPGTVRHFQNKFEFTEGSPNYEIVSISGTRSAPSEGHFTIEQGFVATMTGEAYWVEISNKVCYLVRGNFQDASGSFNGEWLSSDGARGSYDLEPHNRSTLPRTPPEDDVTIAAIGVPVV